MKKGKQQSISKMWDNVKQPNVYAIKVPENRLRRQNPTPTDPRAQQTHEENMSRHFIIKLLAMDDKEKNCKSARRKRYYRSPCDHSLGKGKTGSTASFREQPHHAHASATTAEF